MQSAPTPLNGARIRAGDLTIVLPAYTPYDWELLVQHLAGCVRSDGEVVLQVAARRALVHRRDRHLAGRCAGCGHPFAGLACRIGTRVVCLGCVRAHLTPEAADADQPLSAGRAG